MTVEGQVAEAEAHLGESLDVEADVLLFFFEGVGKSFAEVFGCIGKGQECMGHDFDGEQFVAGEAVKADGSFVGAAQRDKGGKAVFAGVLTKLEVGGTDGFGNEECRSGVFVG